MVKSDSFKLASHLLLGILFALASLTLEAQLNVTPNNSGQQLADVITGNGVVVSNVTFGCPNGAAGTFLGTGSNIGIDRGILLTSGDVNIAVGPNSSGSSGQDNNAPGDADLDVIAGVSTFDACGLEFDLTPYCDTIQIKYVFGSDEYDEFVCASVNDAFGFFISGPGFPTPTNIALIPGTTIPVSINSVNNGSVGSSGSANTPGCNLANSSFFTTNNVGTTVEYDGFTVVLTAKAAVQACQTYHLKLAIADGGDGVYDSGVFLEEGGISCTTNPNFLSVDAVVNDTTVPYLVEGCVDGAFIFNRIGDTTVANSYGYQVIGTAGNGVDYTPLTGIVNFPANTSQVTVPITAFVDTQIEGLESIIVVVIDSTCAGFAGDTAILEINDIPIADAGADISFCEDDTSQLMGVPYTGATINWTPATGLSDPTIPDPIVTSSTPGVYEYIYNLSFSFGCDVSDTVLVTVNERPTLVMSNDTSFCEGEGGAPISVTAMGGSTPYYYTWWCDSTNTFCGIDSTFDDDPFVNPDTSTWYYVQVSGNDGCLSDVDSVFVTVLPKPIVDAGTDEFICPPSSAPGVVLNPSISGAAGPYSYQWSPGLGLNNPNILNPYARPDTTTIYTLTVTAGNGCTSDATTTNTLASVVVNVNPLPVAVAHVPASEVDLCLGDSIQLQGQGFAAGPVYDFEWSPLTGLSNPNSPSPWAAPIITTEYVLTVWSNGCPSYGDTVRVNVHTLPSIDAGPDIDICLREIGMLDGEAGGDSSSTYDFFWTPGLGIVDSDSVENPMVSPDSTTLYYLNAISEWGCIGSRDSVLVTVKSTPIAEAGPTQEICEGDSVLLPGSISYTTTLPANPSQVYFSWTTGPAIDDSTLLQPTVWPSESQWYFLEATYNLCSTVDSALVTVFHQPVAVVGADTNVICSGDSVQLYAEGGLGGAMYTWSPSTGLSNPMIANPMAAPGDSIVYSLLIEEAICSDSAEFTLNVIPSPEAAFFQSSLIGCAPLTVNFLETSTDATNYVWNFGDGSPVSNIQNPQHDFSDPGEYTVSFVALGEGACADSAEAVLVQVVDGPEAEFSSDPDYPAELYLPVSNVQFLNLSERASDYVWNFGDGNQNEEVSPAHLFQQEGEFYVTLTAISPEGCADTVVHGPYFILTPTLFIPNVFSPNADDINDEFQVDYAGSQPYLMQVFDRWGVMLFETKNKNQGWPGIDSNNQEVPSGAYFYRVTVGEKEYTGDVTLVR